MAATSHLVNCDLQAEIDWLSPQSHLLLNSKLPSKEKQVLQSLAEHFHQPGVVWIASSGSSKKKEESLKLIALSKAALKVSAVAVNQHLHSGKINGSELQDLWIQALPRFHVGGLGLERRALQSAAKVISGLKSFSESLSAEKKWDAEYFYSTAESQGATLSALVPTQVYDLVRLGRPAPRSLRAIIIGGASLDEVLYQQARKLGWPLLPSFGMTECGSQIATAELSSLAKVNFPELRVLPHCRVKINAEGFLQIESSALLQGYAQQIGDQQIWIEQIAGGVWTSTDQVEIKSQGQGEIQYLKPLGRHSDFIKINGEGVDLAKLREVLAKLMMDQFSAISLEVALLDQKDDRKGTHLVLVHAELVSASEAAEIIKVFNQHVSGVEKIHQSAPVASIPRSALGKIQWEELRRLSCKI